MEKSKTIGPGAGLRSTHFPTLLSRPSSHIQWFEIITENFLTTHGRPRWVLEQIRRDYPLAFHGVSLSIGGPDPLDGTYLQHLKSLIADFQPFLVSDHFCWTGLQANNTHNLLPLVLNQYTLDFVVSRIHKVQEFLGRPLIFENASAYMQYEDDNIPEWEFIEEVCRRSGCGLLLDINNLYVTSQNLNLSPEDMIKRVPSRFVAQIHLAGHTDMGTYLFDTHSKAIQAPVWELYDQYLAAHRVVPTMIEWDDEIPSLEVLEEEAQKIALAQKNSLLILERKEGVNSEA